MPFLARLTIKTALVYLAIAFLGWFLASTPVDAVIPIAASTRLAQTHLFVVGWLTQLIFGVAFWFFPRHSREAPYGPTWLAWAGYVLLNVGLPLRLVCEPLVLASGPGRWGLVVSALLQWLGALCQAAYLWTRVKAR